LKTSTEHLPEHKREELKLLINLIVEKMTPDFVILFGSYARGNWVEDQYSDDGIIYEYKSDYDILVVTETKLTPSLADKWRETEKLAAAMRISVSVNLIQHSYGYLKSELGYGNYFFTDIIKEGIMLYDNGRNANFPLAIPETIDPEKVKARAKEEYDLWFESASEFLLDFKNAFERGSLKNAAFHLHQATERYYTALLLVFTGYKAKIHDIEDLGSQAELLMRNLKRFFLMILLKRKNALNF
jgi:predicted nucleotidyltransferase